MHAVGIVLSTFLGNSSFDDSISILGQVSLPIVGADKVNGGSGDFGVNF